MLAPHPGVRGPLPKHTPVLVDALRSLGCEVVSEPWGRHSDHESVADKVIGRTLDIPRIRRRLNSERFDVMVVKTSHEGRSLLRDVPLLAATRRLVPKIVVQFHGGRSDYLVAPGQPAFKAASAAVFALSDGVLLLSSEEARESHRFWPRGRFRVVSNPFAGTVEDSVPSTRRNGHQTGPLSLLFVGRMIKEKGIFETLTAFASLSERHDCRMVMVGDGPQVDAVAQVADDLGLRDRLTLEGVLEGARLHQAYLAADLFVFPSYREGFPTAVTEAMAVGLPVVTTRTRGMADHLVDERNALLVSPGDAQGLTKALERIVADGALRERMSVANQAKAMEFAPRPVAEHYLATLQELVTR
jgi:glycosyltransferase involved in cell wall biosynthesis